MLKWLLLKNKIKRKPWLLESDRFLSDFKVHRLVLAQGGYPSTSSIMENARIKAGKTLEEWAALTGFRFVREERKMKSIVFAKRRKLIAITAGILLIAAFFGLTPKGRALAEEAIATITEFFDNVLYIHPVGTSRYSIHEIPEASPGVPEEMEYNLKSLGEISNYVNEPFLYLHGEEFELVEVLLITYSYRNPGFTIEYYRGASDIVLSEQWPAEDQLDIVLGVEGEYFSYSLPNGNTLEGSYLKEDQSFAAAMICNELVFSVFANDVPTKDVMYEILDSLTWSNEKPPV
ncbi:MAG: hypothetical protein BGN88_07195 [Clostridiales bacterium 43-6]|jgi:hypothetical protein|nr:MAG: hypothetical protein BGN88_07195 [Clostridiales bacterium 43-6]